jgi:hypothetical protein
VGSSHRGCGSTRVVIREVDTHSCSLTQMFAASEEHLLGHGLAIEALVVLLVELLGLVH